MDNLHKSPEMLAYEQEQQRRDEERNQRAKNKSVLKSLSIDDLNVPSMPGPVVLLIQMCQDANVDFKKLAKVIHSDPGMAVKLLQIANSSFYGQCKQVTSVVRALTVIGLEEVRTIGLSYKLMSVIREYASVSFDFDAYWEKSLVMAVLAREIARDLGSPYLNEAFLAGLIQDIGIVILRTNKEDEYRKIADTATGAPDMPITKLEHHVFGIDHAYVGAEACTSWKFSLALTAAVRNHHKPPPKFDPSDETTMLHAAAYAAGVMPDFLVGNRPMVVIDDLITRGIVDPAALEPMFSRAHAAFVTMAMFFDFYKPKDTRLTNMMSQTVSRLECIGEQHLQICKPPD